jgi:hypothetical protein
MQTTAALTSAAYTISDARDAVLEFESMIGCTVRTAHAVADRLASIGATFERFELTGWELQTFAGVTPFHVATLDIDVEVSGVAATVRVFVSGSRSRSTIDLVTVEVGARAGGILQFTTCDDHAAVRAARVALGMTARING